MATSLLTTSRLNSATVMAVVSRLMPVHRREAKNVKKYSCLPEKRAAWNIETANIFLISF